MTGGGWTEWSESQAGAAAAAATPRTTAEGGEAAAGAALEEAWAATVAAVTVVVEVEVQWASLPSSVGCGLAEELLGELRSLQAAPDTVLAA